MEFLIKFFTCRLFCSMSCKGFVVMNSTLLYHRFHLPIIFSSGVLEVNEDRLKSRCLILQRYLDHQPELEVQALFALQALVHKLQHPSGIVLLRTSEKITTAQKYQVMYILLKPAIGSIGENSCDYCIWVYYKHLKRQI